MVSSGTDSWHLLASRYSESRKRYFFLVSECVQIDRKRETGCLQTLNHHLTLFPKASEEKKRDKYGVFLERFLTVTAWGDRQIDLLEQLVLLTLAVIHTNHSSNLMR